MAVESPGTVIRDRLAQRGWTQADLARVIGRTVAAVNEVIQGKRGVTTDMAALLGAAFGDSAAYWLSLDAQHRAGTVEQDIGHVVRRVQLYELAPIREMERRGWIKKATTAAELERELVSFFGISSITEEPHIGVATRRTDTGDPISPAQRAWCFRVKNIARALNVSPFDQSTLAPCSRRIRELAAFPEEARKLPRLLAKHGIRFVVVEPLTGSKIDGATLWLDPESPVIAVSVRFDRIDAFWHTVAHEFVHVRNRDAISVDVALAADDQPLVAVKPESERLADEEAAHLLVPREQLESFIVRVGPMYSKTRIIQFANRVKMHPGIVVGQLQHRGELGYSTNREMLVKIRQVVTSVAVTDGWGNSVPAEFV